MGFRALALGACNNKGNKDEGRMGGIKEKGKNNHYEPVRSITKPTKLTSDLQYQRYVVELTTTIRELLIILKKIE